MDLEPTPEKEPRATEATEAHRFRGPHRIHGPAKGCAVALSATMAMEVVALWMASHPTDAYATTVYPALSNLLGFLPGLVPFSVAEWVIAATVVVAVAFIAWTIRAVVKAGQGQRARRLGRSVVLLVTVAAAIWCLFMAAMGLNYDRPTFAELSGMEPTVEAVEALPEGERMERLRTLCRTLGEKLDNARAAMGPVDDRWVRTPVDPWADPDAHGGFAWMGRAVRTQVEALDGPYPGLFSVEFSLPKPVGASRVMSLVGITGFYFPYTAEANINVDWPRADLPATMGHELAHRAGFMVEAEANYLGYRSCVASSDPLVRYSGYAMAYGQAMAALRRVDPDGARAIARERSCAVTGDRVEDARIARSFTGPLMNLGDAVNDGYLKVNGQGSGIGSYGEMVELLLADQERGTLG